MLRVTQKPIQKKTLAVWQRGFNSPDDTHCATRFEVMNITFICHRDFWRKKRLPDAELKFIQSSFLADCVTLSVLNTGQ
jgi:hypothetical protein